MSVYKKTIIVSLAITCVSLVLSLGAVQYKEGYGLWFENVCIGIFASGLLMFFSSIMGYLIEEKKTLCEYSWKIKELKDKVLNFQTLSKENQTLDGYFIALSDINSLLRSYFAIMDNDFLFIRRKKIQKLLEIHTNLQPFNTAASEAILYYGQYRTKNEDENGNQVYSFEQFRMDIKEFVRMVDNYQGTEMSLVMWLQKKEVEYSRLIFGENIEKC